MPDTIREQIIQNVVTLCADLTTNTVDRVQRYHAVNSATNVSIWDAEDIPEPSQYGVQHAYFPITVYLQWQNTDNASVEANEVLGNVLSLFYAPGSDTTFGGLARRLTYAGAVPTYPEDGSNLTALEVSFNIYYATVLGDPFTLPTT